MFALIQSKNHASNKGKTAGRYQFDTHPTGIGLKGSQILDTYTVGCNSWNDIRCVPSFSSISVVLSL